MQRASTIPAKPRFRQAAEVACRVLLECGADRFPISPKALLEQYPEEILCVGWSDARSLLELGEDPFHLHSLGADARTIRMRDSGPFLLVYDDVHVNENRLRWTLAHELGHIALGHLTDFEATALDRGGLSSEAYGVLEVEANWFASELLAPAIILRQLSWFDADRISLLFGLSEAAAQRKYDQLQHLLETENSPLAEPDHALAQPILRQFYHFLRTGGTEAVLMHRMVRPDGLLREPRYERIVRRCSLCAAYNTNTQAKYCMDCGYALTDDDMVDIPGIQDGNRPPWPICTDGRAIWYPPSRQIRWGDGSRRQLPFCPDCLNPEVTPADTHCSRCGYPLVNVCSTCKTAQPLRVCHCQTCGMATDFLPYYSALQCRRERLQAKLGPNAPEPLPEAYLPHPYWEYLRSRLAHSAVSADRALAAALLIAEGYVDDAETLIVFTDQRSAAALLRHHEKRLLQQAKALTGCRHPALRVYLSADDRKNTL